MLSKLEFISTSVFFLFQATGDSETAENVTKSKHPIKSQLDLLVVVATDDSLCFLSCEMI